MTVVDFFLYLNIMVCPFSVYFASTKRRALGNLFSGVQLASVVCQVMAAFFGGK